MIASLPLIREGSRSEALDGDTAPMTSEIVTDDPELPIEGTTEVSLPVERIWDAFADVPTWRKWNPCIAWARVSGGELKEGATLYWAFKPIRRHYLYRMPAVAKIVECDP